jgi:nanoRNase/pAp phosphatase (c-di-AMP/oligoRNAs hydrolase)
MQKEGNILYSRYSAAEKLQYGADCETSDADYALQMMQDIEGFDLIVIGKGDENEIRISLRGRGKYDCNELATHRKGGGHFNAAGCKIPCS